MLNGDGDGAVLEGFDATVHLGVWHQCVGVSVCRYVGVCVSQTDTEASIHVYCVSAISTTDSITFERE